MNFSWKNCWRIGISIFVLFLGVYYWKMVSGFLGMVLGAVTPIVIGFAIAYVLNILMSFYERHYLIPWKDKKAVALTRRPVCLLASILTLCGILALIILLVVPELVSCVSFLISEIPPAIEKMLGSKWLNRMLPENVIAQLSSIDWMDYISKAIQIISAGLGDALSTVIAAVSSVFSAVVTGFLSIIFAIYMLLSKEKLQRQGNRLLQRYLRPQWVEKLRHLLSVLNDSFHRYIVGQCTEAVILGVLCVVGMWIFRFPYATMIGAFIGFTALIPVAGSFIGAGVGFIMIVTVSPVKALLFLVFIIVLQQLESNLIYLKVVGKSTGLPALLVLAAVTVGGSIMGIPGMLIGVPLAAACYRLLREDVTRKESQQ